MIKVFIREFREFAVRGNVLDLAVGIIIGTAFGKIVSSFVADVMMPPLGLLLGRMDFKEMAVKIGTSAAGDPILLKYGLFINAVIDFILIAFAVFLVMKGINKLKRQPPPSTPDTRDCPYCVTKISIRATKCPHCTSEVKPVAA